MSVNEMTQNERIEFLARRVSELETICGIIGRQFTRHDASNLERRHLSRNLISAAYAQYGEKSALAEDSAFREVADLIIGKESI